MLFCDDVDGRVRLETPDKDVRLSGPYTRMKISDQLGAWDIRIQLKRSDEDVPSQSGNVSVQAMSGMTRFHLSGTCNSFSSSS